MHNTTQEDGHAVVADLSDTGAQQQSVERSISYVSVVDSTWVIAIAAGIDECSQPEIAVETAIATIPERITSMREMNSVLSDAHDAVVALGPPWSLDDTLHSADYPAVSMCVAAWSSLGGLIVGWSGDGVAVGLWQNEDESLQGLAIGHPHRLPDGTFTKVLGLHTPMRMLPEGISSLADVVSDKELDLPSDGFLIVLLSAGVWQSLVLSRIGPDHAQFDQHLVSALIDIGFDEHTDSELLAQSILDRARQTDATKTITTAVGRVTAEAQQSRHHLYARSNYTEHEVFKTPQPDTILWRYLDFPKFVSILEMSALYFTRLDLMDDPFEGTRSSYNRLVRPFLYGEKINNTTLRNFDAFSRRERESIYISCWSQGEYESDALWTRYSSRENGIAIRTTYARLIASLTCDVACYVGSVNYVDYSTTYIPENNVFAPIVYKRKEFEYEREVRVVQKREGLDVSRGSSSDNLTELGVYQQVDLELLIDEVRVAPYAQEWFLELVKASCKRIGLEVHAKRSSLADTPEL